MVNAVPEAICQCNYSQTYLSINESLEEDEGGVSDVRRLRGTNQILH